MGLGKVLAYTVGGAVLGVGAIAAAPFTGGGSILGAATLATSLAGAGAVAAGTAAVAGGTGAYLARKEDEEEEAKDKKIAELNQKAGKLEKALEEAIKRFKGDKEYFNYIIGATALGIAMANADGEIVAKERQGIEEFIGGIANSNYPEYIKLHIKRLYIEKPNFSTAMSYLEKINPSNYESLRDLLEVVAVADGIKHPTEEAFLRAFDSSITKVKYIPEIEDNQKQFLLARQLAA